MNIRIYLWLSCVVLAGFVRATERSSAGVSGVDGGAAAAVPDREQLFIDDEPMSEGSGGRDDDVDVESSGSGYGPDDEDARGGRGSGDGGAGSTLEDDEDYSLSTVPSRPDPVDVDVVHNSLEEIIVPRGSSGSERGRVQEPPVTSAPVPDINISEEATVGEGNNTTKLNILAAHFKNVTNRKLPAPNRILEFMQVCETVMGKSHTEIRDYEGVGVNVAEKLRKMDSKQAIYAELLISAVLSKGLLKTLNADTAVVDFTNENEIIIDHAETFTKPV